MARLGDLLKISTDSYKRLEVVYCYAYRHVVVKNNAGNYAIAISDRTLNVNDVLFYATKSISGNTVLCNQSGKDYVVTLKMLSFSDNKEYVIEKLIESQNAPLIKTESKKVEKKKPIKPKKSTPKKQGKKKKVQAIKISRKIKGMTPEQKAMILSSIPRNSSNLPSQKEELKGPPMRVISIPMGGQKRY